MYERLKLLRDYFSTVVFMGDKLVFISEDSKMELTEHCRDDFANDRTTPFIRVRQFIKTAEGKFEPGHYEDFFNTDISDLAGEIEKYVLFTVGVSLKE
jgi:hypothetical protein